MWHFAQSSPEIQFLSKLLIGIYPTDLRSSLSAHQLRIVLSSISSGSCPRIPCNRPCRLRTPRCSSPCYRDQPGLLDNQKKKKKKRFTNSPSKVSRAKMSVRFIVLRSVQLLRFLPVLTHALRFQRVPDVDVEVVVSG